MRRLVHTSAGWLELDPRLVFSRVNVLVVGFGEDGWQTEAAAWGEKWTGDKTLADVIHEVCGVDAAERKEDRTTVRFVFSTFGLAAIGLLALLIVAAVLIVRAV